MVEFRVPLKGLRMNAALVCGVTSIMLLLGLLLPGAQLALLDASDGAAALLLAVPAVAFAFAVGEREPDMVALLDAAVKPQDLDAAGVLRVPRMTGVRDGKPLLADGRVLDVANVIWCTGFHAGLSWVDLPNPLHGVHGEPVHEGGIVPGEPGFYFVGLHFLYSASSTMIHGIARDAERIAATIQARLATTRGAGQRTQERTAV